MEFKKPKTFGEILMLQQYLDKNIHSSRERTLEDMTMSFIAECVEFNEETKFSHKTWKTKEYDREKELEELTDIFFFFAQMINYCDTNLAEFTKIAYLIDLDFNEWKQKYIVEGHIPVLYLIEAVSKNHLLTVSDSLIKMIEYLLKLQVKDENKIRIINNHIFREKPMSDKEIEEKQIEFCKSMRENYREAGKTLEIIEYSMTEVS